MRTPSRLLRSASLLLALLSAVVFGNVQEAACEMHGLGAMASHAGAGHHASEQAEPMGGSGDHRHGDAGGERGDAGSCCCIDACSAPVTVASAPAAPTLLVAFVAAEPRRMLDARATQPAPPEPDRLLPFANGPPAGRLL